MNNLIIKKKTIVEPILELYRGKIYCNIINYFIFIITKHLDKNIFNIKKSFQRTLTNILSSWLFTLYSINTDKESDVFIPSNFTETSILEITLMDFTKYDTTIENPKEKIKEILEKFTEYYASQYQNLCNYKKSAFYLNEKSNYTIYKKYIIQERDNKKIGFYKYTINIHFGIKNEKLENILNNILIPVNVYNKMVTNYTGNKNIIDAAVSEFSIKGYDGSRVDEISARAGINKNLLYHHFGSKDELFTAVLLHTYESIRLRQKDFQIREMDPVDGMHRLVIFTGKTWVKFPEYQRILSSENMSQGRHIIKEPSIGEMYNPLLQTIRFLLDRGAEKKLFKSDIDPIDLYISITSLTAHYFSNRYTFEAIFDRKMMTRQRVAKRLEHAADMILSYIKI
jgi:TetR/AcrR family transcriptional regulator